MRRNYSLRIPHSQVDEVFNLLYSAGLKSRDVQHSLWSFEGEGVYITMYSSGILLIQGVHARDWVDRILEKLRTPEGPVAGCDEAGKGDIFGPLVLCCAVIPPENYLDVLKLAPKDSKKMKDEVIIKKARMLKELVRSKCVVIMPERFNQLYKSYRNINRLMDDAYRKLIERIDEEFSPSSIVVDGYSAINPFQGNKKVRFIAKGESEVEVSVASILARAKFLEKLKKLKEETGLEIPKSGDVSAKRLALKLLKEDPQLANRLIKTSFNLS